MTDSKTATERLREILDERGVRWTSKPTRPETTWAYNGWWYNAKFEPWSDSTFRVTVYDLTPEQAIAATMGSGECKNIAKSFGEFECSECGMYADFGSDLHRVKSCPDCGKVVSA